MAHGFMSHKMLINPSPSPSLSKRQPLLRHNSYSSSSCTGFAEVAGGTTAECAAVCCCCPCGLVNFLFLTIYKVPAGLCRRALRNKRRKQLMKQGLIPSRTRRCKCGCDDTEIQIHPMSCCDKTDEDEDPEKEKAMEKMMKLEKEMWETFYGTGFWRSPSQREPLSPPTPTLKSITTPRETPKAIDKVKVKQPLL